MSIREKLFLFVLFGSVLPLLLVFSISYSHQKQDLQSTVEESLSSQATQSIKAIHDRVLESRFTLFNFSEMGVMQRVQTSDAFDLLQIDINRFAESHPIFSEITALNASGDVIASTDASIFKKNYKENKEFREALKGDTYISLPEYSSQVDFYVSHQSMPILSADGSVVGVLLGALNWAFLDSQLSSDTILGQAQSKTHIISVRSSTNGVQLYQSPGGNISLSTTTQSTLNELEEVQLNNGEFLSLVVAPDDVSSLSESSLLLHIFVDKSKALAPITSLTQMYMWIGAFVFTLVGIMWWMISKSIGYRIANLTEGARELSNGNFKHRIGNTTHSDEIGELAQSFDFMRHTIQKNEAKLIEKTHAAEQAAKLKGEFLANMSHEVRTPINGVLGMAELMLQTDMDINQKRYASTILRSGQSLLSVVNDILDFSKIEAGKLDITKAPFDLRETVEDVAEMLAESAHRKKIELNIDMSPDEHAAYEGDAGRIRQILVNLVSNAIKFTSSGEVKITISSNTELNADFTNVRFDVTDTGIGIPADKHNRIFREFEQADGTTTREYGGTGLGLAISKKLTTLMKGEISFESEINKGSNFWFTVQLQPLPVSVHKRWSSTESLTDILVLIVDDNQTNREILHDQLAHWGAQTLMATGPAHALQLIDDCHKQDRSIDVAIVDQQMPKMSGIELITEIEATRKNNDTAFVVLSSVNENRDNESAKLLSNYSHITKPARQKDLYNCLAAVLSDESAINTSSEFHKAQDSTLAGDVLLVEDNPVNQEMMMEMLKIMGMRVELAENGEEAVTRISEKAFDLIFMDCQMPVMDGFEATAAIRSEERFQKNRQKNIIVALTANALEGDRERCLNSGMDDYLSKPVSTAELRQCLYKWIRVVEEDKETTMNSTNKETLENTSNLEPQSAKDATSSNELPILKQSVYQDLLTMCEQASEGFYDNLVAKYTEGSQEDLHSIKTAIKDGNAELVRTASHRLKSSSANWGGVRVADLCQQLESAGQNNELTDANNLFAKLEIEVNVLISELSLQQRAA